MLGEQACNRVGPGGGGGGCLEQAGGPTTPDAGDDVDLEDVAEQPRLGLLPRLTPSDILERVGDCKIRKPETDPCVHAFVPPQAQPGPEFRPLRAPKPSRVGMVFALVAIALWRAPPTISSW